MEANKLSKTYCMLAFHGFNQRNGSACCHMNLENFYKTHTELVKSEQLLNIQRQMNLGEKPKECSKCWKIESLGLDSLRIKQNQLNLEKNANTNSLVYLSLFTGNICNFACRTCAPLLSFQLINEDAAYRKVKPTTSKNYSDFSKLENESFSHLKLVEMLGGEPLFDDKHLVLLDKIQKDSHDCNIFYSTNASLSMTEFYYKNLSKFKSVKFGLSIDAIGLQFEYIRTNGKWNIAERNVKDLISLTKTNDNIKIGMHVTISVLNLLYLEELSDWVKTNNLEKNTTCVPVIHPEHYSFDVIQPEVKQFILDNYQFGMFDSDVRKGLESAKFNPLQFKKFKEILQFTTDYKKLDYKEYIPKISILL